MRKKIIFIVIAAVIIGLLCCFVGIPLIRMAKDPSEFRDWVDAKGAWGPVIYVGVVIFQIIIAFIPGEPLEIVAGYAFGAFKGTVLCMLSEALGSILVIIIVRKYGKKVLEIFFPKEKIESLNFLHTSKKKTIILLIFFIVPGTPKDLLCYYAGLTDIPFVLLVIICGFCRFPSIITSTVSGDALGTGEYGFAVLMFGITAVVSVIGVLIYYRIGKKKENRDSDPLITENECRSEKNNCE